MVDLGELKLLEANNCIDFDCEFYRNLHKDLKKMTDNELVLHYVNYGNKEGRICSKKEILKFIDLNFFTKYFPNYDTNVYKYFSSLNEANDNTVNYKNCCSNQEELKKLLLFHNIYTYQTTKPLMNKSKIHFRLFCFSKINYIRNLPITDFCETSIYESVLIEFRCLPHLEFLIRNTIIKLGEKWSYTVICGNLNYNYMLDMCQNISTKIKIIKTNYDNLLPSEYSLFLSSLDFWNLLNGEKILIYQEDSIIFKTNIEDFTKWDYIGAPWSIEQNDNNAGVGNGGISLRTKTCMIDIINRISIHDTIYNSDTIKYVTLTNSSVPPEDVYFSKNMEDLNIGMLADRENAIAFSTETIVNKNSFCGHTFWINDTNWTDRIYENNAIQFKTTCDITEIEHRGGWKSVLNNLITKDFYNNDSNFYFFDIIEKNFLWDTNYKCNNKWSGIIHCTPYTPGYLNIVNIQYLFKNDNFIESLQYCVCLFTLSNYITDYLQSALKLRGINIPIFTLKHPVDQENIILFDYKKYIKNHKKKLLQIGQQLRKVSSIYLLNAPKFEKIWLTGTKNFKHCADLFEKEIKYLNKDDKALINQSSVLIHYTETYKEYDYLLSKNIVFVDLFDAAANNTVLECIVRNTPIIINRISPIFEYLGENYPLYFNKLTDVPELLTDDKILEAHIYLTKLDKSELSIDYFTNKLLTMLYDNFSKIQN